MYHVMIFGAVCGVVIMLFISNIRNDFRANRVNDEFNRWRTYGESHVGCCMRENILDLIKTGTTKTTPHKVDAKEK